MHDPSTRIPRVIVAGLIIVTITLLFSYNRISSTTYSLLWPEPELPFPLDGDDGLAHIFDDIAPMVYGTSARPPLKAMPDNNKNPNNPRTLIADLPDRYIPSLHGSGAGSTRRLVIVGDVHGQKTALEHLLEKINFDQSADHLVLTGDMTNKGPDSAGVIDMAMSLGASAVRGNHDDRVLLARAALDRAAEEEDQARAKAAAAGGVDLETKVYEQGQEGTGEEGGGDPRVAKEEYLAREAEILERDDRKEVKTARTLSPAQVEWLAGLPVILNVGRIPRSSSDGTTTAATANGGDKDDKNVNNDKTANVETREKSNNAPAAPPQAAPPPPAFENLLVVHAGLVPGLPLHQQDPWAVMTMRTLVYPVDDERRAAVEKYLRDRAEKREGRGKLAALQAIDDGMVDDYLERITRAQGLDARRGEEVVVPSDGRGGTSWWEVWNRWQEGLVNKREEGEEEADHQANDDDKEHSPTTRRRRSEESAAAAAIASGTRSSAGKQLKGTTVVYGHDAKSGLKVPDTYGNGKGYTYGLDSGCVYGGKLSALVIEARPEGIVRGVVQVGCDKAVELDGKS
ncbi:hypothetical protein VPNG_03504 [Cytospora leucostoma]|uniref:Calcineurin-like phosphoesterase domain-containing protein n=1 Tax=Cytospora leucostoma TaxID=1230097 RepID=A0A423XCJ4_9PEZI|nr:hypothetical protein VPNG_03504 [Cytospora leucostoma]